MEGLKHEDEDWQRKAHTAALSIQDLTVKYFETTARAQKCNDDTTVSQVHLHTSPTKPTAGFLAMRHPN